MPNAIHDKEFHKGMKKTILSVAVLSILACSAVSCDSESSSSSAESTSTSTSTSLSTAATQASTMSPEEAYENLKALMSDFTDWSEIKDVAEVYYTAAFNGVKEEAVKCNYPAKIFEAIKNDPELGESLSATDIFGTSDNKYDIGIFLDNELSESELKDIEKFYKDRAKAFEVKDFKCKVTKGYDIRASVKDYEDKDNKDAEPFFRDNAKAAFIEGEGWKIFKDKYEYIN